MKPWCSRGAAGATLVVCRTPDDDADSGAASEAEDDDAVEELPEAPNGAAAGAMQLGRLVHMQRGVAHPETRPRGRGAVPVAALGYAQFETYPLLLGAQCTCSRARRLTCTRGVDAGHSRAPGPLERGLSQRGAAGGLARSSVPALQLGRASQGPATLARRTMGARAAGDPGTRPNTNLARRSSMAGGLRRVSVSTRPLALDSGDVAAEILPPSSPGDAHFPNP